MQRQPESSLWSLIVASDLPKRQGGIPVSGSLSSIPGLGGDSRAGMGVHVPGYLLTATEPSEHFVNAANLLNKKNKKNLFYINFYIYIPSSSQTSDAELT